MFKNGGYWFFRMVDKKYSSPSDRLLAVFSLTEQYLISSPIGDDLNKLPYTLEELEDYLVDTATLANANIPADLSKQLFILLLGALKEEADNPEVQPIKIAIASAQVVINHACSRKRKTFEYASLVATFLVGITATVLFLNFKAEPSSTIVALNSDDKSDLYKHPDQGQIINQDLWMEVFNLNEKIRMGICPAPHLLDIPEPQMIAYMNVTNYRLPKNPAEDRANLQAFVTWYEQEIERECNYPRKSGFATVYWRQ